MAEFQIGDTMTITGTVMAGSLGTVVHCDEKQGKHLVRVAGSTQNFCPPEEIDQFFS